MKAHIEQNKWKVLWSDLFLKNISSNTNERSDELLKMKGQMEKNEYKVLWAFNNERTN